MFWTGCLGTNGPSPGDPGHLWACPPACLSTSTTVSVHRSTRTTGSWGSFFFPLPSQLYFFFNKQSDHRVLSFTTLRHFLSTSLLRVISQLGFTVGYVFTVTPWRPECGWFFFTVDSVPSSVSKWTLSCATSWILNVTQRPLWPPCGSTGWWIL